MERTTFHIIIYLELLSVEKSCVSLEFGKWVKSRLRNDISAKKLTQNQCQMAHNAQIIFLVDSLIWHEKLMHNTKKGNQFEDFME